MATETERAMAIIEALRNDPADAQMMENIAVFCIRLRRQEIIDAELDPDNLTTAQKARVILDWIHHTLRGKFINAKQDEVVEDNDAAIKSAGNDIDEVNP